MGIFSWVDSKVQNLRWYDISLTKLSTFFFALMIAKLWAPILSLEWYWYLGLFILAAIIPMYTVYFKK